MYDDIAWCRMERAVRNDVEYAHHRKTYHEPEDQNPESIWRNGLGITDITRTMKGVHAIESRILALYCKLRLGLT